MQYQTILGDSTIKRIYSGQTTDNEHLEDGNKHLMQMSNGTIWNNITDGWCKRCDELTPAEKEAIQWTYLTQFRTLVQFQNDFGTNAWRMAFRHGLYKHIRIWRNGHLELRNMKGEL